MGIQQMLLGGGGVVFRLDSETISHAGIGSSAAGFRLDADGQVYILDQSSSPSFTARYNWITPTSEAANYDCRWTAGSGTVDSTPGAASTNLALTSDRTWSETNNAGVEVASFTVTIHNTGDTGNALATAIISLEVDGS